MKLIDPFTVVLLAIIVLAAIVPAEGQVATGLGWAGTLGVGGLFFAHGAALSRESIVAGITHWRLHLLILAMTFGVCPLIVVPISWLAPAVIPPALATGFLYLGALPSAVTSSIAFTAVARGNVAAAVCAAAASNVFGLMATPFVFMLLAHSTDGGGVDVGHALIQISVQLLMPFAAGQLSRPVIGAFLDRHARAAGHYDKAVILLIVYTAFSQFVASGYWRQMSPAGIAIAFMLCIGVLALMMGLSVGLARLCGFDRADETALLFCGSKKSLASGLPMANVLFAGQAGLGLIILPIMIYNQTQIIVSAVIARLYAGSAPAETVAERAP
ncbi:bile acid:sodium symporter family protein [Salinisphaera sp. Q1T1-3]|uniref:bile acid:sodium symporter family protein n=1 Tax=Salinisphaera sp. Q1T1-3 TaxID=2321229 RepID=UPI000E70E380|nr:bile acid:sodium symporter family protein [Salinisphaera sp. Q1T1-3]RJS95125.1 bile acid:sodium symporter [Salinisphaera sp. Q1T1-3]